jgi:hypothetical protein
MLTVSKEWRVDFAPAVKTVLDFCVFSLFLRLKFLVVVQSGK